MNKTTHQKLVHDAATESGLDETIVRRSIDAYLNQVATSVHKGVPTPLYRIGTLRLTKASPKKAWSFTDEKVVVLPERMVPKITFTRKFVQEVREK